MSPGLSTMLREGTRKAHRTVEDVAFIRGFLRGVVDVHAYARLLAFYQHLYGALEAALDRHATHEIVGPLVRREIYRQDAVALDLQYFRRGGALDVSPSPATRAYCARVTELAAGRPELLVAHAYTRYLGDLSGGQILKNIAARALSLGSDGGTAFYEFPAITNVEEYKTEYRAALDAMPLSEDGRRAVVDEAIEAFRCNQRVFEELEGNALKSLFRVVTPRSARRNQQNR